MPKKKDPMAGLPEGKLTLEQARQVINAHRDAERAEERKRLLPLIGRYFKYRNNYGRDSAGWWLYAHVTGVDAMPMCTGWTFQRTENDSVEIDFGGRSTITIRPDGANANWTEIPAAEFWRAYRDVQAWVAKKATAARKQKAVRSLRRQQSASEGK